MSRRRSRSNEAQDDRDSIQPDDRVLLIVENDLAFARLVLEGAREKGFKGLVTTLASGALALTRDFEPDAVTLDLFLPDMNGWRVLNRLKNHLSTRHIPVFVISTDEARAQALEAGAAGFIAKPLQSKETLDRALGELHRFVTRPERHLLILMSESAERDELVELLSGSDVRIFPIATAALAKSVLLEQPIDCLVIGPGAPVLDPKACEPLLIDGGTGLGQPAVIFYGADRSETGLRGIPPALQGPAHLTRGPFARATAGADCILPPPRPRLAQREGAPGARIAARVATGARRSEGTHRR